MTEALAVFLCTACVFHPDAGPDTTRSVFVCQGSIPDSLNQDVYAWIEPLNVRHMVVNFAQTGGKHASISWDKSHPIPDLPACPGLIS